MKNNNIFLFLLLALSLSSCNYLDLEPKDTLTNDRFWIMANGAALEQYCNTYYPRLVIGHGDPLTYSGNAMMSEELKSDNLYGYGTNAIAFGINSKSQKDDAWDWKTIRGCNSFLENYHKSPASPDDKRHYAGVIYFFKAWDYFNKMKRFGDLPWYDKVLTKKSPELYKGRDSRYLVTDSILFCLDRAIEYLPRRNSYTNKVSKDAALLLKARICLYEGTWRRYRDMEGSEELLYKAYESSGELMKPEYGYSLYKKDGNDMSYFNLFIQDNYEKNKEVILSREYSQEINMGHQISRTYPNSNYGMSRDCFEEYLCSKCGKPLSLCNDHKADEGYLKEMANRDSRLVQTLCVPEKGNVHAQYLFRKDGDNMRGGAPNIFNTLPNNDKRTFYGTSASGYCVSKFYKEDEWDGSKPFVGSADAIVMRYAEALLIRAEAGAEIGKDPELDKTINLLRERVGFGFKLTMNPEEDPDMVSKYPVIKGKNANLIREIRRERRIELFGEGFRYDDLCRWHVATDLLNRERRGAKLDPTLYTANEIEAIKNKVGVNAQGFITPYAKMVTVKPAFSEKNYLFNIPIDEINLNRNLLPDNPGW